MVLTLDPKLDLALTEAARRQGVDPEEFVLEILQQQLVDAAAIEPRDEWERTLLSIGSPCGVTPSHEEVSSEGLYD